MNERSNKNIFILFAALLTLNLRSDARTDNSIASGKISVPPPLEITTDQVAYENLRVSVSYATVASESTSNITPRDYGETFIPATVIITGNPFSEVVLTFILPTQLIGLNSSGGDIYMTYDNNSGFDESSGNFFDPRSPHTLTIPSNGETIVRLGGNPSVDSSVEDIEYGGYGIITAEYAGDTLLSSMRKGINNPDYTSVAVEVDVPYYLTIDTYKNLTVSTVLTGELLGLSKGINYTLSPDTDAVKPVDPIITGSEKGLPFIFEAYGNLNTTIEVSFILPDSLYDSTGSAIPCAFTETSACWDDSPVFFNPRDTILIELDTTGFEYFHLGIRVNVPGDAAAGNYFAPVIFLARYFGDPLYNMTDGQFTVEITSSNDITDGQILPVKYSLSQNYPNPFNPATVIRYGVPKAEFITLTIYDLLGRQLAVLVNEKREIGGYEVGFDGNGLPSGIYFARLQAGEFIQTVKMVMLR